MNPKLNLFKPKTLSEFIDYMEEKSNQGYSCYFANGIPIIEYWKIGDGRKRKGKTTSC